MNHAVQWAAPNPLWKKLGATPDAIKKPALLAFGSDQFMAEVASVLATKPEALSDYVATYESNREPPVGSDTVASPSPVPPLKLYQPVHGRFYLVAASLVCQPLGLPDRRLNLAHEERAVFVLRRLDGDTEMAWVAVPDPKKPMTPAHQWQALSKVQETSIAPSEEVLPLFPLNAKDAKHTRRLHAGVIPTASYDSFSSAALVVPDALDKTTDLRRAEAHARVVEPFNAIRPSGPLPTVNDVTKGAQVAASPFILLDFGDVLRQHIHPVWDAIVNGASAPDPATNVGVLYKFLESGTLPYGDHSGGTTWADAIKTAWSKINDINAGNDAPTFDLRGSSFDAGALGTAIDDALAETHSTPTTTGKLATVPKFGDTKARYVIRCFFRRPNCGPLHPDLPSARSDVFQLAQYFDSDAPARTIRIPMPIDTTAAGLRKFPKSVGFLLSDQLQKQICQVSDLAGVLKGNITSCEDATWGEICSFSIPIITIVAMLLLMIFVILLNIVFWWLPFLKVCIPIPLKAKT